jgi:FkbM family methyltransferase
MNNQKQQLEVINTKHGRFIVNPKDSYVSRSLIEYGEYCEAEVFLLSNLIDYNSIVVDCGANIGALTVPLAKICKTLFAFEPHPFNYNILCGNIALNGLDNVQAFKMGLSDHSGQMSYQPISNFEFNNGAHSLIEVDPANPVNTVYVTDQVPACNLLKIDVEGHELQVLKGATSMINQSKPFLYVENDRIDKSVELISYLEDVLKYRCYWTAWCLFDPNNFNENKINIYGDTGCVNMICLPREQSFDFTKLNLREVNRNQPSPFLRS